MVLKVGIDTSGESAFDKMKIIKRNEIQLEVEKGEPPIYVAVGIIIESSQLVQLWKTFIEAVKDSVYGNSIRPFPLPPRKIINEYEFNALHGFELHATEIFDSKKRKRSRWNEVKDVNTRLNILKKFVNILQTVEFRYLYTFVDITSESIKESVNKYTDLIINRKFLIKRLERQAKTALLERVFKHIISNEIEEAVILADRGGDELELIKEIKYGSRYFADLYWDVYKKGKSVSVGITDSTLDFGVQLADFIAYIVRRKIASERGYITSFLRKPFDSLEDSISEILDKKILRGPQGQKKGYGEIEIKKLWMSL